MQNLTIPELKLLIKQKFEELRPFNQKPFSQLSSKYFRSFISLCTSLSIKLMQYDLLPETLEVLIKASEADKLLSEQGSHSEQYWQGRLLTFHTLAFMYYRTSQFKKSLKVLYDSQQIIESILSSKHSLCPDFNLTGNLLIFMNLWKVKKLKESKEYLEISKKVLSQINKLAIKSKLSTLSRANLNGLLSLSTAGFYYWEHNRKKAIELAEGTLDSLLGDEVMVRPLIYSFLRKVRNNETVEPGSLMNKDFDGIILVSCFIPFVSVGTPSIKIVEKVEVRLRSTSRTSSDQSSRRNHSVPQSRLKMKNSTAQPWWNNSKTLAPKRIQIRRTSGNNWQTKTVNRSFETKVSRGSGKVFSPSISNITTPRRKQLGGRAATVAELPLELIRGVFQRPFSSK
jgi:hypothetical protein